MAAYRRVYDLPHLQADCKAPGSAPEPYAQQSSMGYLCLLDLTQHMGQPNPWTTLSHSSKTFCVVQFQWCNGPLQRSLQRRHGVSEPPNLAAGPDGSRLPRQRFLLEIPGIISVSGRAREQRARGAAI